MLCLLFLVTEAGSATKPHSQAFLGLGMRLGVSFVNETNLVSQPRNETIPGNETSPGYQPGNETSPANRRMRLALAVNQGTRPAHLHCWHSVVADQGICENENLTLVGGVCQ